MFESIYANLKADCVSIGFGCVNGGRWEIDKVIIEEVGAMSEKEVDKCGQGIGNFRRMCKYLTKKALGGKLWERSGGNAVSGIYLWNWDEYRWSWFYHSSQNHKATSTTDWTDHFISKTGVSLSMEENHGVPHFRQPLSPSLVIAYIHTTPIICSQE